MNTEISRREKLLQIRANSLTAEHVYSEKLRTLARVSNALLLLSVLTPLIIIIALYPSKGTAFEPLVQWVSYALSGILLVLAITSLALQVELKKESYSSARSSNTFIANESLELIDNTGQDATWFFRYVSNQDAIDQKNIAKIDDQLRKEAYRESLKRLVPGDSSIKCPACNSSPYQFSAGSCQLCGNEPPQQGIRHGDTNI